MSLMLTTTQPLLIQLILLCLMLNPYFKSICISELLIDFGKACIRFYVQYVNRILKRLCILYCTVTNWHNFYILSHSNFFELHIFFFVKGRLHTNSLISAGEDSHSIIVGGKILLLKISFYQSRW